MPHNISDSIIERLREREFVADPPTPRLPGHS
jgi:hypothetical protein